MTITGYWHTSEFDLPFEWLIAIAMALVMVMVLAMVTREPKPSSILPSHDETHPTIADFPTIIVSASDGDIHLFRHYFQI